MEKVDSFAAYGTMVKEPLVGTPWFAVLTNGSWEGSVVAVVPQWIIAVHVNVSPKSLAGNVTLSSWPVRFLPGVSVKTGLVNVKPFTPAPSVALIVTLAYSVVLLSELSMPNLYVCTPPVLANESRCTNTIWLKLGAAAGGGA